MGFIWPSLVSIALCLFDLCWPLTSEKVTIVLHLLLGFIWPSLVSITHTFDRLTSVKLWPLKRPPLFYICVWSHQKDAFYPKYQFWVFAVCWKRLLSSLKWCQNYEDWPFLSDDMVIFRCSDVLFAFVLFKLCTLLSTYFFGQQMHPFDVTAHIYIWTPSYTGKIIDLKMFTWAIQDC